MSYITHFKQYYPNRVQTFMPNEPQTDLLQAVIACGNIDPDVVIEYFESDTPEPNNPQERYGSSYKMVPETIREQARAYWEKVLNPPAESVELDAE